MTPTEQMADSLPVAFAIRYQPPAILWPLVMPGPCQSLSKCHCEPRRGEAISLLAMREIASLHSQ
jgi:hypothetical protein